MHDTSKSGTTTQRHPTLTPRFWKLCCQCYTTRSHQLINRSWFLQHTHYNLAGFQAKPSIVYSCKAKSPFINSMFVSGQAHQWLWQSPSENALARCEPVNSCSATQPSETPTNHFLVLDSCSEARYKLRPKHCSPKPHKLFEISFVIFLFSSLCRLLKCLLFSFLQVCLVFFSFKLWVNILLIYSCWLEGFACCLSLNLRECQNKQS